MLLAASNFAHTGKHNAKTMSSSPDFLQPVSLDTFFSTYWEKQPLHIERNSTSVEPLLSIASIENLLATQPLYFPGVQLTQSGKTIDVASYADAQNQILPLRLLDVHNDGATIVISQAQKLLGRLSDLCRQCTQHLQMRCQANIYLSAPGNQGFNAHYDTHDVFILQVSGSKTFNFYPSPVELPCPGELFDATRLTSSSIDESVVLSAGDTLYIPRGVVHDAIADDDSPSLHITLGVYPIIVRDVLQEAVERITLENKCFRESFAQLVASSKPLDATGLLVEQLSEKLKDPTLLEDIYSQFLDELALDTQQDCRGVLQAQLLSEIPLERCEKLTIRQNLLMSFEQTESGTKVRTFGQVFEFEEPVASLVALLCERGSLEMVELDILDLDQREALVARLLRENLIEVS